MNLSYRKEKMENAKKKKSQRNKKKRRKEFRSNDMTISDDFQETHMFLCCRLMPNDSFLSKQLIANVNESFENDSDKRKIELKICRNCGEYMRHNVHSVCICLFNVFCCIKFSYFNFCFGPRYEQDSKGNVNKTDKKVYRAFGHSKLIICSNWLCLTVFFFATSPLSFILFQFFFFAFRVHLISTCSTWSL